MNIMSLTDSELQLIKTLAISRSNLEKINRQNMSHTEAVKWINHHIIELELIFTKHTQSRLADFGGHILLHRWQRAKFRGSYKKEEVYLRRLAV